MEKSELVFTYEYTMIVVPSAYVWTELQNF